MIFVCIIPALFLLVFIKDAIKAALAKKWLDVLAFLLFLPFLFFFLTSCILGGSAFHDAQTDYALYQTGHYYLFSHGTYTEVSYSQFKFMETVEIVGISTFVIGFIIVVIRQIGNI